MEVLTNFKIRYKNGAKRLSWKSNKLEIFQYFYRNIGRINNLKALKLFCILGAPILFSLNIEL